jgi:thiamine-monophosphate kinase
MAEPSSPFTPISQVGEFGLIDRLHDALGDDVPDDLAQGIGDDAAVYRIGDGRVHVVTTDALVEGVHFDRTFAPLGTLGFKALAVNVSDVVAMNAEPRYATVAIGLPNNMSVEATETLYDGLALACRQYGLSIIGGDVAAAERLFLSITVVGEAAEDAIIYRRGARPGDLLCVTGDLGSGAAGLKILLAEKEAFTERVSPTDADAASKQPDLGAWSYVVQRQLAPSARLDRIRQWREAGVQPNALIDISDGLASEVHHLCRAGGVGARLEAALFPIHAQTFKAAERFGDDPAQYALYGGEDYELLFAISKAAAKRLPGDSFAVVGAVTDAAGEVILALPDGQTQPLTAAGFQHF